MACCGILARPKRIVPRGAVPFPNRVLKNADFEKSPLEFIKFFAVSCSNQTFLAPC